MIEKYADLKNAFDGTLNGVFTERTEIREEESIEDLRTQLMSPEVMPCMFDTTVAFWLERLDVWGKLLISWKSPDKWRREKIPKSKLLDLLTDDTMINLFGKWNAEKLTFKSVKLHRKYIGIDGKKKSEDIIIDIDLTDDLKRSMKGKY